MDDPRVDRTAAGVTEDWLTGIRPTQRGDMVTQKLM